MIINESEADRQILEKGKQLAEALKKDKPYLLFLDDLIQKVKFGQLNLTLRFHDGFVTDVVVTTHQRKRFDLPKAIDKRV